MLALAGICIGARSVRPIERDSANQVASDAGVLASTRSRSPADGDLEGLERTRDLLASCIREVSPRSAAVPTAGL
jgi:hypothetical protein